MRFPALGGSFETATRFARVGGDEFVILCNDCDQRDARQLTARIGDAIREPLTGFREDLRRVTASIGVACLASGRRADGDELLHAADAAMCRSKAAETDTTTIVNA